MASRLKTLIELLHAPGDVALATQSIAMPGFPFATSIAFAADEHHRPLFLISRLAEHTQCLNADPRASLLVARTLGEGEIARASLIGNVTPFEPDPLLKARYLRYHPEAERFLMLGDFQFHRFEPLRIRVVGGFAQAGWLDGKQLIEAPTLSLEAEAKLIEDIQITLPEEHSLLGIDAYGVDYLAQGQRQRSLFKAGPIVPDAAGAAMERVIKGWASRN
jgi:heme iron utilization protein